MHPIRTHGRGRQPRETTRWVAILTLIGLALTGVAAESSALRERYQGRLLAEVLREFRDDGLNVVFSSAVVPPELRVPVEPSASDPRLVLEEILAELDLRLAEGPGGALLVLGAAPPTGTVTGVVTNTAGAVVTAAEVKVTGSSLATTSLADGTFRLKNVTAGVHEVTVTARGYSTATISRVGVDDGTNTPLEVVLRPYPTFVTEVVVTPGRHSVIRQEQAASRTINSDEAVLAPTIGGDITRVIELLPGVTANDNSAAFNVRGSTSADVSLVLDGLELYDPYHLQGFQSPFSVIDSNVVDRIDFLGGGFTADRGDRHGGFVDISTVTPTLPRRGEVELGTLNSRVSYKAPLRDGRGSWLLSARGWYPEKFADATELASGDELDPRFADLYLKSEFLVGAQHRLSTHGLFSYDRLTYTETDEEINEEVDALARHAYGWIRAVSAWSPALTSETLLSGGRIERIRDGIAAEDEAIVVDDDRVVHFFGVRHDSTISVNDHHALKVGADVRRLDARYRYMNLIDDEVETEARLDPDGTSLAVYAAHRVRVTDRIATEYGFRWDRQTYTNDNQLSPRFNAIWNASDRTELRLALGRYNQSQRIHELHVEDGETEFSSSEVSEQAELSVRHTLRGGMRVRVDAYYRELSDLRPRYENLFEPIELFPETTEDRIRIEPDEARLQGVELLIQGPPGKSFYWWTSYTLSAAEDLIDGVYVDRSWDQTHAGKFLVGYRREGRWSVSLSGTAHTGWPTTPLTAEPAEEDDDEDWVAVPGERNTDRFDRYGRLDLKARRAFDVSSGRIWLTFEVVNLTDRNNTCCLDEVFFAEQPDGSAEVLRKDDHWLGITPSFSVQWEF